MPRAVYAIPGLRKILAGRNRIPFKSPSTPSTVIPTMRNGSKISHTNGYAISANSASGQQSTNKMHHKRKRMEPPPSCPHLQIRRKASPSSLTWKQRSNLLRDQIDPHVVVAAFRNDHVRVALRRLHEFQVHRPHRVHVLLHHHFHGPPALA